ncbi:hypothetical protein CLOP_g7930 [Closterium sp. NIES-67]|nr:hypothetical protein CLOP_g7930 [Closterium sp. NIES-67]
MRWLLALEVDGRAARGDSVGAAGADAMMDAGAGAGGAGGFGGSHQQQQLVQQAHSQPGDTPRRSPILLPAHLAAALSIRLFDPLALKAAKAQTFARIAAAALCTALDEALDAATSAPATSASVGSDSATSDATASQSAAVAAAAAAANEVVSASLLQQQLLHESLASLSLFYHLPPSSLEALLAFRTLRCFLTATPLPLLSLARHTSPFPSPPSLLSIISPPLSSHSLSPPQRYTHQLTIDIGASEPPAKPHLLFAPGLTAPAPPPSILASVQAFLLGTLTAMPEHIPSVLFFLSCLAHCPHHHPLARSLHRALFSQLIPLLSQPSATVPSSTITSTSQPCSLRLSTASIGLHPPPPPPPPPPPHPLPLPPLPAPFTSTARSARSAGYLTAQPLLAPLSLSSVPRFFPLLHALSANPDVPPGPIVDLLLGFLRNEKERGERGGKGGKGEREM